MSKECIGFQSEYGYINESVVVGLDCFIQEGLRRIGIGDYKSAVSYLRNPDLADILGFDLVVEAINATTLLTYDSLQRALLSCSSRFLFCPAESKQMYYQSRRNPGRPLIVVGDMSDIDQFSGDYGTAESKAVEQQQAYHHIGLNYAEAWIAGLHYLVNGRLEGYEEELNQKTFMEEYLARHNVTFEGLWLARRPFLSRVA